LGIEGDPSPIFGWKARVPLISGRFDRTEVDLKLASLLIEAKLTEGDFQTREASIVEAYRDFDAVFDRELLPRVELFSARRKEPVEFLKPIRRSSKATSMRLSRGNSNRIASPCLRLPSPPRHTTPIELASPAT